MVDQRSNCMWWSQKDQRIALCFMHERQCYSDKLKARVCPQTVSEKQIWKKKEKEVQVPLIQVFKDNHDLDNLESTLDCCLALWEEHPCHVSKEYERISTHQ